jgi:eukaryotic-like serine/threonine-protein kinase
MNTTFGRYRLLERIGQGGMAEVYKAKSYGVEGFEKLVVIKRILPDLARSKEFVDMFIHEAKLAVRLSHANIVQVFDLGLAPGGESLGLKQPDAYYMAMEHVHGLDLATLLAKCRRESIVLPVEMCTYIVSEVAKGLDYAHRRRDEQMVPLNIVHRDVSPQNILLSLEGEVKVTDFGIAKARGALDSNRALEETHAKKLQGKFSYMSPEQARGEVAYASSDIFSLGTVLYECLAGVSPFSSPTTFETLRRVQQGEYPPITLLRQDLEADLVELVRTAMAKDPSERFQDAGKMHEALLAFQYGHGHRFSSAALSQFLSKFRAPEDQAVFTSLDAQERTPVEAIPLGATIVTPVHLSENEEADAGERRDVTALAVATAKREAVPDDVIRMLERYGGKVSHTEVGLVVARFGLTDPDGRDTETAARAGFLITRTFPDTSVGIHVGRVLLSRNGEVTEDERARALSEEAIKLAGAASAQCAVSPQAARIVKPMFEVGPLDHLMVKGNILSDMRPLAAAFGRFVGRREQLRRVGEVLAFATRRRAQALTVRGDQGVGKTRLLVEVERRLRKGNYNVGFHLATCPPRGRTLPLSGITCMLQELCGVKEGSPANAEEVLPRLRALGLQEDEVRGVLGAIGAQVEVASDDLRSTLRSALSRIVLSLCEDRPHLFVWDAAHWIDADSMAVLESIFEKLSQTRVVFAFAGRAGFSHSLSRAASHVVLELGDLTDEEGEKLIAARLGVLLVPAELVTFVRERAGGHPLFIEEVIKGLLSARAITVAERKIVTLKLAGLDLALPKTLRGLVASRVANLDERERSALHAAAVVGDPIDAEVLVRMTGQPFTEVERSLRSLTERDLLIDAGPMELRFRSPIVREVVVDSLPAQLARDLHRAAGTALEQRYGDSASEHASRIATHLYEAGESERAASYFAVSGNRRSEARQLEGAVRDYARALSLCDPLLRAPTELGQWLSGLANAARLVRAVPEAMDLCERVIARVDLVPQLALQVSARVDAGRILGSVHMIDAARAQFVAAEQLALGDDLLSKLVLSAGAELASRQGNYKRSLGLYERLEKLMGAAGSKQEEHKTLVGLAQARAASGDRRGALSGLSRAERLLPADATASCERARTRCLSDYFAADYRAASASCELAIDSARLLGLTYEVAENLLLLGEIFIRLDDLPRAYGAIKQAAALADEGSHERMRMNCLTFLSFLDAVQGDRNADKILKEGIDYAEARDFTSDHITGTWLLAVLQTRRGARDAARAEYVKLLELAREAGNSLVERDCETFAITSSREH